MPNELTLTIRTGPTPPDRLTASRMLHALADRVECGCADVQFGADHNPLEPHTLRGGVLVTMRDCLTADHAGDWGLR